MPVAYPWNILELEEDGVDARAVKRAYAQKLKKCRPDENPEGFQKLRKARDHALLYIENLKTSDLVLDSEEQKNASDGSVEEPLAQESKATSQSLSRQYFEDKLAHLNSADDKIWSKAYWQDFFYDLNQVDISYREDIEWLIIRQLGLVLMGRGELSSSLDKKDKVLSILLLLNDEFGWDGEDQKVYQALGSLEADYLLSLIRSGLYSKQSPQLSTKKYSTIPYIAVTDLRAFMGEAGEDIIQYYVMAKQKGRWPISFFWAGFLTSYLWFSWRTLWQQWLVIVLFQSVLFFAILSLPFGLARNVINLLVFALPFILFARYGMKWVLQSIAKEVEAANKKNFVNIMDRHYYLRSRGSRNILFPIVVLTIPVFIYLTIRYLY